MHAVKCNQCGKVQVEEDPGKIKGTTYSANGVTKHACEECMEVWNGIFAAGADVKDPLKALARVTKERDEALRELEKIRFARSGQMLTIEDIAKQRKAHLLENPTGSGIELPKLGQRIPTQPLGIGDGRAVPPGIAGPPVETYPAPRSPVPPEPPRLEDGKKDNNKDEPDKDGKDKGKGKGKEKRR